MRWKLAAAITLTFWLAPGSSPGAGRCYTVDQILHAIRIVESGDRDNGPRGDSGQAVGPYQIHAEYWKDATGSSRGYPESAQRTSSATGAVLAYFRRYQPTALERCDWRTLATLHHCGPNMTHPSNPAYLRKIGKALAGKETKP